MELLSYSLSQDLLLTDNKDASNNITTTNEKIKEQKTATPNEILHGGGVKLEDIFHAIIDMKQLFEVRDISFIFVGFSLIYAIIFE